MSSFGQFSFAGFFVAITLALSYQYTALTTEFTGLTLVNRAMSSSTIFLLGLVLVLGPLVRVFGGVWKTLFTLRKEIGMYTFLTGFTHVYLSMFPLARRGPWGFYEGMPWSAYPGLFGLAMLLILFIFSFASLKRRLSASTWWKLQYIGARAAFLAILVHTVVLRFNSWSVWMTQWAKGEQLSPPLALVACLFSLYVLAVKVFERTAKDKDMALRATTFVWFLVVEILFIFPRIR